MQEPKIEATTSLIRCTIKMAATNDGLAWEEGKGREWKEMMNEQCCNSTAEPLRRGLGEALAAALS
jgi:hypothetical protein